MRRTIEARLAKVERENRLLKITALVVVAIAVFCGAQANDIHQSVKAREFVLLDAKGNSRGIWATSTDGDRVKLLVQDKIGGHVALVADDDGSHVWLNNKDSRIQLSCEKDATELLLSAETSIIAASDAKGAHISKLQANSEAAQIRAEFGNDKAYVYSRKAGAGMFVMRDGEKVWSGPPVLGR